MLSLALLIAAAPAREPALVDALKYGDGALAQQTLELAMGDAREVALSGGDGEGWMELELERAGLHSLRWPVGGLGGGLTLASCRAEPEVDCRLDATADRDCWSLEADIHCTSTAPVSGVDDPLSASCGSERVRVERLGDGRLKFHGLDRCLRAGALTLTLEQGSTLGSRDNQIAAESGILQALLGSPDASSVFGGGLDEIEDPFGDFDSVSGVMWGEAAGVGSGGGSRSGGGGGSASIGGLGGGGILAVHEPPPPPEPWPAWSAVKPHGDPIEAPNEALAIAGGILLAAEDDQLVWFSLDDGAERGRVTLGGHRQGREIDEICASPDGSRLGVVWSSVGLDTEGGAYELWSLDEQARAIISEQTRWSVHHCAFTADGRWFAVGARQGLWVFDAASGIKRRSAGHHGDMLDQVTLLAPAPRGHELLLLWGYERLATLDVGSGAERSIGPYDDLPLDAAWLPDGRIALADDGTLVLDAEGREKAKGPGSGLALAALGPERLLVSTRRGPVVLDLEGEVLGGLGGPARLPESLATSADGGWMVIGTWEGLLRYRVVE
jgi:hypothetical protein